MILWLGEELSRTTTFAGQQWGESRATAHKKFVRRAAYGRR